MKSTYISRFHSVKKNFSSNISHNKQNMTAERLRTEDRKNVNKFPGPVSFYDFDKDLNKLYSMLYSEKPNDIFDGLSKYSVMLISGINKIFPRPPPPNEIIDRFIELADNSLYETIAYEASNDLYLMYINFPSVREYLLQNQFYVFIFNHLNKVIYVNFTDAIEIDQLENQENEESETTILEELARAGVIKSVFDQILNWKDVKLVETIPNDSLFQDNQNQYKQPIPESVLASNIYVFFQFMKYNIDEAINLNTDLTVFLLQINLNKLIYKGDDLQLATLRYLSISLQYTWESLLKNNYFSFILQKCVNEKYFNEAQYLVCLEILKKASFFCSDYLISEGLISTIHAVFSKFSMDDDYESACVTAIDICTEVAKKGSDNIILLISDPDYSLSDDIQSFSDRGSYPIKVSIMRFALELIKYANIFEISNFLASMFCIQFMADFLESNVDAIFIDLLNSLVHLIDLTKKDALSQDLSDHLFEVFQNSSILNTLNDFLTSQDFQIEINPEESEDFHQSLQIISQQTLNDWSEINGQNE